MRKVGEDVSEVLDYIPGRFEIIRHIRPAYSCRRCERMVKKPMPSLPVERGRPSAGLLAHILVSSIVITFRCIARPASMPATGLISTAR
jgi:transposase